MEPKPLTHKMKITPENAWVFDIDGVITNPSEKEIKETEILTEIIKRLQKKEPVALVSGRAYSWIDRVVLQSLTNQIEDKALLDNLFVSAEFGGITIKYANGDRTKNIHHEEQLPQELTKKAKDLIQKHYKDIAFVDEEKEVQFTVEMKRGITVEKFKPSQIEFSEKFREFTSEYDTNNDLEVHEDRIATNIKNKKLNKHFAIKGLLKWLEENKIGPKHFEVFGDSLSDFEMGRELSNSGYDVRFIFVGNDEIGEENFEIIRQGNVDKGTAQYLATH
jgi:trehalose-phosphatase